MRGWRKESERLRTKKEGERGKKRKRKKKKGEKKSRGKEVFGSFGKPPLRAEILLFILKCYVVLG